MKHLSLYFLLLAVAVSGCSKVNTSEEDKDARLFELYVNYPGIKPAGHKPPEFDIRLANLIDNARKEVYWAMYGFYRASIKDSVLRAVQRGLDVQLAGDVGTYSYGEIGYIQFEDLLRRYPNAKLLSGNAQSIQHNKFCVIDRRYIMTGTGNITDSEIDRNYNVWMIIESKEMAEDFINDHQQMMAGRFGHAKSRLDYNNVFNVGQVRVEAYFSPQEDAMSRFLQAVSEAQQSINFAIFAFTHDQLGRLFIQKHKQFTQQNNQDGGSRAVRGIMDRSQLTHNQYVEVYRLATSCGHTYGFEQGAGNANGGNANPFFPNGTNTWDTPTQSNTRCYSPFDLKIDGNENNNYIGDWQAGGGRLHAKTIVIDAGTPNAKLLLGSFNWSPNANNNNDENLIVIHSPAIVERYMQFWKGIYDDAVPMNKRFPTNQEMQQGIVTYQPREAGDYQKIVISEVNYAGTSRKIGSNYFAYDGNEFIELYNPTDRAIDVSFWSLYFPVIDSYTDPGVYTSGWPGYESLAKRGLVGLPGGTFIPAKGFLVVTQSDQRNDLNSDGYFFPASVLYDPANTASYNNKITYYNPVNGLSNFFTLFDRRTSSTGRANVTTSGYGPDAFSGKTYPSNGGTLTFVYPAFDEGGRCRSAWDAIVDRFSGSNYFNPYHIHADNQTGYPHQTSLWIELRDNRGNLVDIVGGNRTGAAVNNATGVSQAPTA
ncbi:MAG: phospholipase D-like domain-containing protein, partial [Turneriella sp.]